MNHELFIPNHVVMGMVTYELGHTFGPRIQPSLELVFLYRGDSTVWIDDKPFPLKAGTATLLLPGHHEYFEFASNEHTAHSYIHIYADPYPPDLIPFLNNIDRNIHLSNALETLMKNLLELRLSTLPTSEHLIKINAMQLLWRYIGESQQQASTNIHTQRNDIFIQAKRFIQENHQSDITLADIARATSVSQTHLIRVFNQHAQTTPMAYLWDLRVNYALEMLNSTGLSITEIAYQCGFKTSYHFSRRIKQATGLTPSNYRKRAWGQ